MPVFEYNYGGQNMSPRAALAILGPSLEVAISVTEKHAQKLQSAGKPIPAPVRGIALIDTGASVTAVDEDVCRQLGLSPTNTIPLAHAGGSSAVRCYPITIHFPPPLPPLTSFSAASCALRTGKQPHILLFGRDLLSQLRLVYNGPQGRIEIAF